ncbi:hypothetical protein BLS_005564 [Venturia inaequalis]|uniref:Uncharacterized protein n=1 Tax=Venturia inaequalis TaxID=5025 RepID=A0A8H3YT12_VENIN|nr:hypothetical protein BLS_005564 [Venturia inaequalis]
MDRLSPSNSDENHSLLPWDHEPDDERGSESEDGSQSSEHSTAEDVPSLPQYEYGNAPLLPAEQYLDTHKFKAALYRSFRDLAELPVYSAQECLTSFPDPGLHIEGIGPVPLPLYEHYITQITTTQGQMGANCCNTEGSGLTNIWEMDCTNFQFRNPAWLFHLQEVVDKAAKTMGVVGPVKAQCSKLVLMGSGASIEARTKVLDGLSSESFGILALCLPTEHEGGQILLRADNETSITLETASNSAYGVSSVAWYSDLSVELKPLSSGFQLMVFYRLFHETRCFVHSSSVYTARKMKFEQLLKVWRNDIGNCNEFRKKYMFLLRQKISSQSNQTDCISRSDSILVDRLQASCSSNGYHVLLAELTRIQRAPPEEQYDYDFRRSKNHKQAVMTLKHLQTYDGEELLAQRPLSESDVQDILQHHPFSASPTRTFDDKNPLAGLDGPPLVLQQHKHKVVILVPTENLLHLIAGPSLAALLKTVCERTTKDPTNSALRATALNMIDWGLKSQLPQEHRFFEVAVQWCLKLEDHYLLNQAITFGITDRGENAASLFEIVANHKDYYAAVEQPDWNQRLGPVTSGIKSLNKLLKSLWRFGDKLELDEHQNSFRAWSHSVIDERLIRQPQFRLVDTSTILWLIKTRDPAWIIDFLLPLISSKGEEYFVRGLLLHMMRKGRTTEARVLTACHRHLMRHNVEFLTFEPQNLDDDDKIEDTLSIFANAIDLDLHAEVISALSNTIATFKADKESVLDYGPVLRTVQQYIKLGKKNESTLDSVSRDFITLLLERPIDQCMDNEPPDQSNWARREQGCGCIHCEKTVVFLADPEARSREFLFTTQQTEHIFQHIRKAHFFLQGEKSKLFKSLSSITFHKTTFQHDLKIAAWKNEIDLMREAWKPLQEEADYLERLLGERYRELVFLEKLRHRLHKKTTPTKAASTQQPSSVNATPKLPPKVAGKKRKKSALEIIEEEMAARRGTAPTKRIAEPPVYLGF